MPFSAIYSRMLFFRSLFSMRETPEMIECVCIIQNKCSLVNKNGFDMLKIYDIWAYSLFNTLEND